VGDAALLVLPSSPKALAEAIRGFVLDAQMRKAYGAQARKRAQTVHDARLVASRIAQVYERIMVQ
jgi:glycosyltransferase involved in cell wall biosynthesis